LIVHGLVVLAIVAVLRGRREERPAAEAPRVPRDAAPERYHAFNGVLSLARPEAQLLVDTQTGVAGMVEIRGPRGFLDLSGAKGFDLLSVSPWCDASGQHHLAGRWWGFANGEQHGLEAVQGVARSTFPEGRVIDRIAIDTIMSAPPCWFPDRSDRILFAGADGRLYVLEFPQAGRPERSTAAPALAPRPQPVRWATADPEADADACHIRQPCWPSGTALGGCLVVSIYTHDPKKVSRSYLDSRLWWLQLSPDATEIVAAGRLIEPDESASGGEGDECHPNVCQRLDLRRRRADAGLPGRHRLPSGHSRAPNGPDFAHGRSGGRSPGPPRPGRHRAPRGQRDRPGDAGVLTRWAVDLRGGPRPGQRGGPCGALHRPVALGRASHRTGRVVGWGESLQLLTARDPGAGNHFRPFLRAAGVALVPMVG
jgi:hypothetical protein